MTKKILASLVILMMSAATANAEAIQTGGKNAVTGQLTVTTSNPDVGDDTTTLFLAGLLTHITPSGRWEYGGGLQILALLSGIDLTVVNLLGTGRINSDLLGPEQNIVAYFGVNMGLTIIDIDAGAFEDTQTAFAGGPRFGLEYYLTPRVAVQLEDYVQFDTEDTVTNILSLGVKLLFDGIPGFN